MFAFNKSHMNQAVKTKLIKAIVSTKKRGHVHHVNNRKGNAFLAVRVAPSGLIVVTDQKGRNVKNDLLAWNDTRTFNHYIFNNLSNLY